MTWFQRDHTGRALAEYERDFVAAVSELLADMAAPQIDPAETALTAEGNSCLIVLIPHRALGGLSIVVWLDAGAAQVIWAQVVGLDCCHDSLDMGVGVARFTLKPKKRDFRPVLDCIRGLIDEPVTLRCFAADRATILVRDHKGKLKEVGQIGQPAARSWRRRAPDPTNEVAVRLSDALPPPITEPSGGTTGSKPARDTNRSRRCAAHST